jgi:hypothetical protein
MVNRFRWPLYVVNNIILYSVRQHVFGVLKTNLIAESKWVKSLDRIFDLISRRITSCGGGEERGI